MVSWINKWEFVKYKLRQLSISYSKQLNKSYILKEINEYSNKLSLTEDDRSRLLLLQSQLDEIYMRKSKGAYIRSRAKWMKKGRKIQRISADWKKSIKKETLLKLLILMGQSVLIHN